MPCSNSQAQWRLGRNGITIDHIVLTALHNLGGDIWQAELDIEF